jgi:aquaporin Z
MDVRGGLVKNPLTNRAVVAEFLGTLLLVFFAVGAAAISGEFIGTVGIALSFGFALLVLAYVFGPISGCHINPAVTLGMLAGRRIDVRTAVEYWIAQIAGAIAGAALLRLIVAQIPGFTVHGRFGTNGYGHRSGVGIDIFGAFVTELLLTFLLVFVYLVAIRRVALVGIEGVPIGISLVVIQMIGIPLTGASVNPARSLGPAIFAGTPALNQVWLFLVAPLVGALLAAAVHYFTHPALTAAKAARAQAVRAETAARTEPEVPEDPAGPAA